LLVLYAPLGLFGCSHGGIFGNNTTRQPFGAQFLVHVLEFVAAGSGERLEHITINLVVHQYSVLPDPIKKKELNADVLEASVLEELCTKGHTAENSLQNMSGTPVAVGTAIYLSLGLLSLILVQLFLKHDVALARTMVVLTTICTWLMWLVVYLHQMNPLIIPELKHVFVQEIVDGHSE